MLKVSIPVHYFMNEWYKEKGFLTTHFHHHHYHEIPQKRPSLLGEEGKGRWRHLQTFKPSLPLRHLAPTQVHNTTKRRYCR